MLADTKPNRGPVTELRGSTRVGPAAPARRMSLLDRLDSWIWRLRQRDEERYLAQSQNVIDLERRIREIERSIVSRAY